MGLILHLSNLSPSLHCCKVLTDFSTSLTGNNPCHVTDQLHAKGQQWGDDPTACGCPQQWGDDPAACGHPQQGWHTQSRELRPLPASTLTEKESRIIPPVPYYLRTCTKYSSAEFKSQPQYVTPDLTQTLLLRIISPSYVWFSQNVNRSCFMALHNQLLSRQTQKCHFHSLQ